MKKYLFIIIYFLVVSGGIYAQKRTLILVRRHVTSYYSFSADGGVAFPLSNFGNAFKTSGTAGLEFAYHPNPSFAVFADGQYNFLTARDTVYNGSSSYLETTFGGRLYLGKGPARFFAEASMGDYIYRYSISDGFGGTSIYNSGNFGISVGLGEDIAVARRTGVFIKAKYNTIFTPVERTNYITLLGGIRFIL